MDGCPVVGLKARYTRYQDQSNTSVCRCRTEVAKYLLDVPYRTGREDGNGDTAGGRPQQRQAAEREMRIASMEDTQTHGERTVAWHSDRGALHRQGQGTGV